MGHHDLMNAFSVLVKNEGVFIPMVALASSLTIG
jgi:hypothetical protein